MRQISQSVDVISAYAPLDGYKLVAAPDLNVLPQDLADHLLEYVHNGGHLVLGPRSGMKDEFNALLPQRQPGFLVDALGARVEQYYALEKDVPVAGAWGNGQASIWAEQLKSQAPGEEVLLKYGKSNGWLDGQPVVITRAYGKGRITYVGAVLDDKLMATAAEWVTQKSGVTPAFGAVPDGVEVSRRVGSGKQVFVLINYSQESRRVTLPHSMSLILDDKRADAADLPPYGVAVALDSLK
jgi:beta-galactosidase